MVDDHCISDDRNENDIKKNTSINNDFPNINLPSNQPNPSRDESNNKEIEETDKNKSQLSIENNPQKPEFPLVRSRLISNKFVLHLQKISRNNFCITVYQSPFNMGDIMVNSHLPFSENQLRTILKVISSARNEIDGLSEDDINSLEKLKLIKNGKLIVDIREKVGAEIFNSLFVGEIKRILYQSRDQLRNINEKGEPIHLELRFSENEVYLMQVPWELMASDMPLLINETVSLSRYILDPSPLKSFQLPKELKILFVESRPTIRDWPTLWSDVEFNILRDELTQLNGNNNGRISSVIIDKLEPPTFENLQMQISEKEYNILHFDGHGGFLRKCPICNTYNLLKEQVCINPRCNNDKIAHEEIRSYLAFEEEATRNVSWIRSDELSSIIHSSNILLAILSACRSGQVTGNTIFNSVGTSILRAGVPIVIAMQLPILQNNARLFIHGFYRSLAINQKIPNAVKDGRLRIFSNSQTEWFVPVLLSRSSDNI